MNKLLLLTGLLGLGAGLVADVILYEDDFSSLPLGVDLGRTNSPWWFNNFNTGDVAYTQASADGPDGAVALTLYYEVFGGRWYGGLLRNDSSLVADLGTVDPANVRISFWLKGTSTQSRGAIGFSVLSFDASSGTNVNTGAAYKKIEVVPAAWTQFTLSMAEMDAGIPAHASAGKPFDWATVDSMQVIIWPRSDHETGWPTAENEGHKWSFSLTGLSIVLEGGAPALWAGYEIVDGWVDTGPFLGWLYVAHDPWIYSLDLGAYVYLPETSIGETGGWAFVPN